MSNRSEDFLLTVSRVVSSWGIRAAQLLIWLWFARIKVRKRFFFKISAVLLISASQLAFWDSQHFECFHLKEVTWTQPCNCQFNHCLLPRIYNKGKEKELSFMSSLLLQKRSITVYKSQLYRIMWQNTWLMYAFEELRITQWEIAQFLLFLILNIVWAPCSVF